MMDSVLSVQGIHKHYSGFALEDVTFSLAPNRIMGLIGKNGALPCFKRIFTSTKKSANSA